MTSANGTMLLSDDRLLGLWFVMFVLTEAFFHFDDLLRTSPDNHVELSSVCVRPPGATSSRIRFPQPFAGHSLGVTPFQGLLGG